MNTKEAKQIVSQRVGELTNRTKIEKLVKELIDTGFCRIGDRRGSRHSILTRTGGVITLAKNLGLVIEGGNDAPLSGNSGYYVMLVADKRKNRIAHRRMEAIGLLSNKKISRNAVKRIKDVIEYQRNVENTESQFESVKGKMMLYCLRKGITFPLSNKEANSVAWKKQNYITGGVDVVTLRGLLRDFSRRIVEQTSSLVFC